MPEFSTSGMPPGQGSPDSYQERPTPPAPRPQAASIRVPRVPPTVTYSLLVATVLVYLAQRASLYLFGFDLPAELGMKENAAIAAGEFWRLITPMFLHGSILHIGFNMYALHIFGPGLERHFSSARFMALYLLSGFAGNVASLAFSTAPSLGSSTAIFGLLAAQGVFLYRNREIFGGSARRALNNIVMIAGINLVIGLSPGIDNWGHLGGLVGGTLFSWLAGPILDLQGLFPDLNVVDRREPSQVILAGLLVLAVFGMIAVGVLFLR